MKFTLGWLKDHLETDLPLAALSEKLTALGLEVESVTDRAALYAPFRVAYVEKAEKHPDADRLKVCVVDTGKEKLQVVCGAPNARAGMKAVFAPAGSFIPGTGVELKKGVIRGQESNGMLVSEREMGLSDEHTGIIDVAADVAVGTPFAGLYGLDDPVIEISLTPNRADCAGVRGIARDLAAAGAGKLKPLDEKAAKGGFKSTVGVELRFANDKNNTPCPLYVGRYIKGVKNGPSPRWLQDRLKAIGLRPISALVDITNYVSYDLCRPLHVFDADRLKGGIHVRPAKKGESFRALNGKDYTLEDGMTVIADDDGVLGLGGIIGGEASGCTEASVNVYLECAYFDPAGIARTGRALQIDSDARYRFERGVDPAFTVPAAEIATRLILEFCGGTASETVIAGKVPSWAHVIDYSPAFTAKLAGLAVEEKEQKAILEALGFTIKTGKQSWQITPPAWRGDVLGAADIVEEVVRVHGFDKLPATPVTKNHTLTRGAETPELTRQRRARAVLASRGMNECITWSFMPSAKAALFGANDHPGATALTLANPISADLDRMRPCVLPPLIEAAQRNKARGFANVALFEIGPAFINASPDGQRTVAAGLRQGAFGPRHWADGDTSRAADAFDVKADALAVLKACGMPLEGLQITRDAPSWYHPGRSGALRMGRDVLAYFGEIHPGLRDTLDAALPLSMFEVFIDSLPALRKKAGTAKTLLQLPELQPVARDFAFLVDGSVESEALIRAIRGTERDLIAQVDIFDVYTGKGVPEGKKSVAISVILQPRDKTLTDADLEAVAKKITDTVAAKTGGVLRA